MQALTVQLEFLPPALFEHLHNYAGGFVKVCLGQSKYAPGPAVVGSKKVYNVAYVSVEDLALGNERPLHVIGHLVDHHLGCGGTADGAWLSGGGGVNSLWQEAGARLTRLFALGYGIDGTARSDERDYFAQSLALYCHDRRRLNVADPQIDKWMRSTLWDDKFWGMGK